MTYVNVSRSIPDIIRTEFVTNDGLDLTVMVNKSRNHVMTETTALATERKQPRNGYRSGLQYKRAGQDPQTSLVLWLLHMLSCFLLVLFYVLERKSGKLLFI